MRRLYGPMLPLVLPVLLLAADAPPAKHNALTPKQVSEGWLLLFDGETTFGWTADGEARVEKGVLVLGGTRKTVAEPTTRFPGGTLTFEASWEGETPPSADGEALDAGSKGKFGQRKKSRVTSEAGAVSPVRFSVPAGSTLRVRNVKFLPAGMRPLFNGKDLTGWRVFEGKGKKSRFTVKDNLLNVKDGPGDIQTEKLYDDFVLQVEGRTNGKHLNSGIFFRCIPGQYQNGYEAQIRHQFTEKPTQKYQVEEFDPRTHQSLGKKEVLSAAVDFGTGAIYRRVPARKGVAKDNEWFTLTIVARERHLATWVNGVQVADWTDNRPAKDNPRQGYRAAAGAISIQGHDPTTDLDFRSIRIATVPRMR